MNGSGGIEIFQRMLDQREAKRKQLCAQLDELENEIQSIQHTYKLYKKEHAIPELAQAPLLEHGQSLTKRRGTALVQWAEQNGRVLVVKEAKKALIAAGLLKAGPGAGWIAYGTVSNMDCWEKIQPGKYRLISETLEDESGQPIGRLTPAP